MSYCTILSVINEHTASTVIGRYAISLALECKARLVLYAAHAEGTRESILNHTDRHLDHLVDVADELKIPVTRIHEVGAITRLLPDRVQLKKADLVFYPLTPGERYGDHLQRHTVHQLLRTISSDLAIMRIISMAKPHPRQILVPLGTVVSVMERRLVFISELAKSFNAQVTLFHLSKGRIVQEMPGAITRFKEQLQKQQIMVQERSARGPIGKSITVEAITRHHDLIVLGASERGVLQKLFFGNPAGDVMHQPPCNTILFRAARRLP
jgi:nucleotide-binding universal stress UspA family protein